MKKGDPPLAVLSEDRERSPEEKLLISVLTHQIKDYLAAKEFGQDFIQARRNVKLMIRYQIEKKFRWMAYVMQLIDEHRDHEFGADVLFGFLQGCEYYFTADSAVQKFQRKRKILNYGSMAEAYIFDECRDLERDVFSFAQICKLIELDPQKFRDRLRSLDRDEIKQIKKALRD